MDSERIASTIIANFPHYYKSNPIQAREKLRQFINDLIDKGLEEELILKEAEKYWADLE